MIRQAINFFIETLVVPTIKEESKPKTKSQLKGIAFFSRPFAKAKGQQTSVCAEGNMDT